MAEFDNPMSLCSDCSFRATGTELMTPIDEPAECEWCGDEVTGSVNIVEWQEDPGLLSWQKDRDELASWLKKKRVTTDVRKRDRTIDFTIGELDDWPSYVDDELNAIRSSSIAVGFLVQNELSFREAKVHLPPAPDQLQDEIDNQIDLPDGVNIFHGSGALGGIPAPDGVITPHIVTTDPIGLETVKNVVGQALSVYKDVYNDGELAIQTKPK